MAHAPGLDKHCDNRHAVADARSLPASDPTRVCFCPGQQPASVSTPAKSRIPKQNVSWCQFLLPANRCTVPLALYTMDRLLLRLAIRSDGGPIRAGLQHASVRTLAECKNALQPI